MNGTDGMSPALQEPDIIAIGDRISEFVKKPMPHVFAIPGLASVLGVLGYAVAGGVVLSSHKSDMFHNRTLVGLKNYIETFLDPRFRSSL